MNLRELRPIFSIGLIILTLFAVVFMKMEERRLGYEMLKLSQEHHLLIEEKRNKGMQLAKVTRPQLVEKFAQSRLTLKRVQANQIIHLTGSELAEEATTAIRSGGVN